MKKKDVLKAGVLSMLVAGVPFIGVADAAEMPVYSLDEVVVTATRTMKEIQEVPSSIPRGAFEHQRHHGERHGKEKYSYRP